MSDQSKTRAWIDSMKPHRRGWEFDQLVRFTPRNPDSARPRQWPYPIAVKNVAPRRRLLMPAHPMVRALIITLIVCAGIALFGLAQLIYRSH